jgi:hypothetical protein
MTVSEMPLTLRDQGLITSPDNQVPNRSLHMICLAKRQVPVTILRLIGRNLKWHLDENFGCATNPVDDQ